MIIFLNGDFIEKNNAKVNPFNSGFLYGKGFFETFRVIKKKPILLREHIERLNKSLEFFNFEKVNYDYIETVINQLIEINNLNSARVRVTVNHNLVNGNNILVNIDEFKPTFGEFVSVMVFDSKIIHGDLIRMHKSTSYLYNDFAYEEAKAFGYDEAVFVDNLNHMIEGTRTNVFIVKNGAVYTPSLDCGILPGITRKFVIESGREAGIIVKEKLISYDEFLYADEIFLTNSLNGIIKVKKVNDRLIDNFLFAKKFEIIFKDKLEFY